MINAVILNRAKKLVIFCGILVVLDKALEVMDPEARQIRISHYKAVKPAAVASEQRLNDTRIESDMEIPAAVHKKVQAAPTKTRVKVMQTKPHGTDVLINTYMRSGSSFVGRVLGYRNDTFYVYEPLHGLTRDHYFKGSNLKCSTYTDSCIQSHKVDSALQVLEQFYKCKFGEYPASSAVRENINSRFSGPSWASFRECRKTSKVISKCLHELATNICSHRKYKTTKVLRLTVDNAEKLLRALPDLKIVHLFRDPRAIFNSHMQTIWSPLRTIKDSKVSNKIEIEKGAKAICERMAYDIAHGKEILKKYPDRFLMIQYEDFSRPLLKVQTLLTFFDMQVTNNTLKYLDRADPETMAEDIGESGHINEQDESFDSENHVGLNSSAKGETSDVHSSRETLAVNKKADKNTKKTHVNENIERPKKVYKNGNHPFEYRKTIPWECVRIMNKHCSDVYKLLGYVKFNSEKELRNLTISSTEHQLPFTLTEQTLKTN